MKNSEVILNQLSIFKLDITLWSARKKLRVEDLQLVDGSKLPPDALASLGSKRIMAPEKLADFERLKKEAERICATKGTRFLGGYAVPDDAVEVITAELERVDNEFAEVKRKFLNDYEQSVQDWINHPDFSEFQAAIRNAVEPVNSVAGKISFDFVVFKVTSTQATEIEDIDVHEETRLEKRTLSISDQLFKEIAGEASMLLEKSLLGKMSVTRKALSPVKKIRNKLDGLGFLDHRVMPVVDMLDELLTDMPKASGIQGVHFDRLFKTVMLLSNPEAMKRHGSGLLEPEFNAEPESDSIMEFDDEPVDLEAETAVITETVQPDFAAELMANIQQTVLPDSVKTNPYAEEFDDEIEAATGKYIADSWF